MATNSKYEHDSIIYELQNIIKELNDVAEVISDSAENIDNDVCVDCLETVSNKYTTIKRKLDNINTSSAAEAFTAANVNT